jgi:transcription elongation factor SPT5
MAQAALAPPAYGHGRAGGRHLVGKSVTIAGGPYKGYAGIVKDVLDSQVRVELHTNSRIVTVDRERVLAPAGADEHRGPRDTDARGARTPAWGSTKTPAWSSAKTPAWSSTGSGKTPAWNPQSGRTPAWNPQSGRTPAWNPQSGRTPAWNAGGKTPVWNASGRTPTWNAGGKTPLWSAAPAQAPAAAAWASAPTPAWNSAASQQAHASAAGDTPAWAQPGILVQPKSGAADAGPQPIASVAPGRIVLGNGQSYRPADIQPAVPAKKDRVRLLGGPSLQPGEPATGTVIGLDGPDAVVRLDDTSAFRIVPLQSLGRIE